MKLPQFLEAVEIGSEPPRAPQALLWVPPGGRPVECPSVEAAQRAAQAYSASKPGYTVAVYGLIGYAFKPVEPPEFTPADSDKARAELRDSAPDTLHSTVPIEGHDARPHRTDLSDAQRGVLERIGDAIEDDEA